MGCQRKTGSSMTPKVGIKVQKDGMAFQCMKWGRESEQQAWRETPNLNFGYATFEFLSDIHVGMVSRCRSLALWERSGLEMKGGELEACKALRLSEITRSG